MTPCVPLTSLGAWIFSMIVHASGLCVAILLAAEFSVVPQIAPFRWDVTLVAASKPEPLMSDTPSPHWPHQLHYRNLNLSQKMALDYVVDHNMSGAIQGPPGTGKTQILQAVISLALQSNMKVCVSAFTNAAVDNLIGRIVSKDFENDWVRVGNPEKVRSELYLKDIALNNFVASSFNQRVIEANLFCATLHKLAFNSNAPKVDLLLIDEAGQVPIYCLAIYSAIGKTSNSSG